MSGLIDVVHGAWKVDFLLTRSVSFPILPNFFAIALDPEIGIQLFDVVDKKLFLLQWQHHCEHVESRLELQIFDVPLVFLNKVFDLLLSKVAVILWTYENEVTVNFAVFWILT